MRRGVHRRKSLQRDNDGQLDFGMGGGVASVRYETAVATSMGMPGMSERWRAWRAHN